MFVNVALCARLNDSDELLGTCGSGKEYERLRLSRVKGADQPRVDFSLVVLICCTVRHFAGISCYTCFPYWGDYLLSHFYQLFSYSSSCRLASRKQWLSIFYFHFLMRYTFNDGSVWSASYGTLSYGMLGIFWAFALAMHYSTWDFVGIWKSIHVFEHCMFRAFPAGGTFFFSLNTWAELRGIPFGFEWVTI